jgi:hypothetical protein
MLVVVVGFENTVVAAAYVAVDRREACAAVAGSISP